MTISFRAFGHDVTARTPTIAELSAWKASKTTEAFKKIARACVLTPPFGVLVKTKAGAPYPVGKAILEACGMLGVTPVELVASEDADENEVPADVAAAMVAAEAKGFRDLQAIAVDHGGIVRHFIQRPAREREVDDFLRKDESVEAAKALAEAVTVWPEKLELDEVPGLYNVVGTYAIQRAGVMEDVALGE